MVSGESRFTIHYSLLNRYRPPQIRVVRIVVIVESAHPRGGERVGELGLAVANGADGVDGRTRVVFRVRVGHEITRATIVVDDGDALADGNGDRRGRNAAV